MDKPIELHEKVAVMAFIIVCIVFGLLVVCRADEIVNLSIISQIESSNNPNAYNKRSGAVGMYQITKTCLDDYNASNYPKFELKAMYNKKCSKIVANWYLNEKIPFYLKHYGLKDTIENRLWAYNAGIGKVKRGVMPKETKEYIEKYRRLNGYSV